MSRLTLPILLNILLAFSWLAAATAAPLTAHSTNEPIHIEADRMESNQQKESVIFTGNVEATQADLTIKADRMTVFYRKAEQTAGLAPGIDNLQATGNIKIIKKDWLASGDRVDFKSAERKIVLTGNTKVWQGNNTVTGDKVILYLDEGKSVIENQNQENGGRVKAFFYPEANEIKKDAE